MALWNKLLKKQEKEEKKAAGAKAEKTSRSASVSQNGSIPKASGILVKPHVTEKASRAAGENKYIFRISEKANKPLVKSAVEERYKVKVEDVKIINLPSKMRMRGSRVGWKAGARKAIVAVAAGQTIEAQ